MTSWAQAVAGGADPWEQLDDATSGTGYNLAGQHDVTDAERAAYRADYRQFKAEEDKKLRPKGAHTTDAMLAAHRIGQAYGDSEGIEWAGKQDYLKEAANMPLGDLSDPTARLKALSFITQDVATDDPSKQVGAHVCAGASIVGAAFLAEGPEGLKKVLAAMEKHDTDKAYTQFPEGGTGPLQLVKEKLNKDPSSLTVADIQTLQQGLYNVIKGYEDPKDDPNFEMGVSNKTMDEFMESSPDLAKMLKQNDMEVKFIDNDGYTDANGNYTGDHYVVKVKGPEGKDMIYDPLARRGGQVIDYQEGLDVYDKATRDTIGDVYKPYKD